MGGMHSGFRPAACRAALSVLLLCATSAEARSVAVAVNEPGGGASVALIDALPPWPYQTASVPIGRDSVLRARGQRIYALSREEGRLHVVVPHRREARAVIDLGARSAPEDLVVLDRRRAYVSRAGATHLLRIDPMAGEMRDVVDLSVLADADGIPDMGRMARHRDRLFVQLRRLSSAGPGPFERPAMLAVVDLRTESLMDADPDRPGVQGIELAGTAPRFAMQTLRNRLYLSATGGFFDEGGIEEIDLGALRSRGLLIREADGQSGADAGAFVLTTPDTGYLTFSTDLLLSSHLVQFERDRGVVSNELHVTLDYFVPTLLHDRPRRQLFLIDGGAAVPGVFVFDALSGEKLTRDAIPTGGVPTDAILIPGRVRASTR
jgi:hypothetical protein